MTAVKSNQPYKHKYALSFLKKEVNYPEIQNVTVITAEMVASKSHSNTTLKNKEITFLQRLNSAEDSNPVSILTT